ncbi:hypothetical protein CMI37_32195 [Candidatus Pacearchaeota archaeon]|nr:hypothetical protein [Candidatus Pacearchaeota archaeon]|tara:strand:+ start:10107 stop:10490 length:384 start_codon:yes stop_codon:yes gene_type:complete
MAHIESDSRIEGGMDFKVDKGVKTPLGMASVQTEAIMKRQQDKPFNVGVFNEGVKGDAPEGIEPEGDFTEDDFNIAVRHPSAIRAIWSDDIAIEVMEALLLNKPFEVLSQKLQLRKGGQHDNLTKIA